MHAYIYCIYVLTPHAYWNLESRIMVLYFCWILSVWLQLIFANHFECRLTIIWPTDRTQTLVNKTDMTIVHCKSKKPHRCMDLLPISMPLVFFWWWCWQGERPCERPFCFVCEDGSIELFYASILEQCKKTIKNNMSPIEFVSICVYIRTGAHVCNLQSFMWVFRGPSWFGQVYHDTREAPFERRQMEPLEGGSLVAVVEGSYYIRGLEG